MSSLNTRISASVSDEWRQLSWTRLAERVAIATIVMLAAVFAWRSVRSPDFGWDLHGGAWKAGHELLTGHSPYLQPDSARLLAVKSAFVTPPLLAVVAVPYSVMPFSIAIALWTATSLCAFAGGLRLLGVRDWRIYILAFSSFPLFDSVNMGQADPLLFLAAAIAWRYRDKWTGPAAVGALIAAKLFAWPLVIWLLAKRGGRAAATATASLSAPGEY